MSPCVNVNTRGRVYVNRRAVNRPPHGQRYHSLLGFIYLEMDYRPRGRPAGGGGGGSQSARSSTDQEQMKLGSQCSMNTKCNAIRVCGTERERVPPTLEEYRRRRQAQCDPLVPRYTDRTYTHGAYSAGARLLVQVWAEAGH